MCKSCISTVVAAIYVVGISSCSPADVSVVDKIHLQSSAMAFDQVGADVKECSLVSQMERGRSASSNGGGSGCAACAQ